MTAYRVTDTASGSANERQTARVAYSPVRLGELCCDVLLRLNTRHAPTGATRFTLHTVSGFRMPDGRLQLERLAGFCHYRHCLKNYWAEQVAAMEDPETGEAIGDLRRWLATQPQAGKPAQAPQTATMSSTRAAAVMVRQRGNVLRAVDRAIACAALRGLDDVAAKLGVVRDALEADDRVRRT